MLPHDKHTCTFRIVYTLYVCNKRINTQLQSMWILNKPWWKEQNIGIPEWGRERCGKIFDYASSKICTTSPFASKIFASPTLCVYPFLSLVKGTKQRSKGQRKRMNKYLHEISKSARFSQFCHHTSVKMFCLFFSCFSSLLVCRGVGRQVRVLLSLSRRCGQR